MKIIKKGKLPKAKVIQHTCKNCNTVFEFDENEIIGMGVSCPLCHQYCKIVPDEPRYWPRPIDEKWRKPPYWIMNEERLAQIQRTMNGSHINYAQTIQPLCDAYSKADLYDLEY